MIYSAPVIAHYVHKSNIVLAGLNSGFATALKQVQDQFLGGSNPVLIYYYSGARTLQEQEQLYQEYLQGGPLAAPAGLSWHNYKRGVDYCIIRPDSTCDWDDSYTYGLIDNAANTRGIQDGRSFGDPGHLVYKEGMTIEQMQGSSEIVGGTGPGWEEGQIKAWPFLVAAGLLGSAVIVRKRMNR